MRRSRVVWVVLVVVLALIGWRLYLVGDKAGVFHRLTYGEMPPCRAVTGAIGAEDIQIDHPMGVAYVAAFDRRRFFAGDKSVRGSISVFSLIRGATSVIDLTDPGPSGAPQDFAPHGLSLYIEGGKKTLAVINHAGAERVELFDIIEQPTPDGSFHAPKLLHRRTITDPSFRNLNDIALVGPDSFYATNDHWYAKGFMQDVENYLLLDKANVVYFDGEKGRIAASGLTYANGIAVGPQGKLVYVSETLDNVVRTYEREPMSGDLKLQETAWAKTKVGFGADNIDIAPDGSLYVAGHPKLFALQADAKDPSSPSPSEVIRMSSGPAGWTTKTVFLDAGKRISGLSVAAFHEGSLVLGSIFGREILVCPASD
jgi:arylesterase/paraoxonase